jgi:hypothetical protein
MSAQQAKTERPVIIVADDEPLLRIMVSQYLEDSGLP